LRRVEARLQDPVTLKHTLDEWLYRTPIQGSRPDAPDDAVVMATFIEGYLTAHEGQVKAHIEAAQAEALNAEDAARLQRRFTEESNAARVFLEAKDRPEAERPRSSRIRAAIVFIESYRELPLLAWPREVVDGVVALEQTMLIFRQRHARMVERVIGRRTGTGGSAGVDYLDQTALRYRVFADIWAVRTLLLRRDALPALPNHEFYDFVGGR
jgi:tryptophan 2,3-dioxygenase